LTPTFDNIGVHVLCYYGRPYLVLGRPLYFAAVIYSYAWPPCVADADIIFYHCGFFFFVSFSSPISSSCRLDVYHTSTHDVALEQI